MDKLYKNRIKSLHKSASKLIAVVNLHSIIVISDTNEILLNERNIVDADWWHVITIDNLDFDLNFYYDSETKKQTVTIYDGDYIFKDIRTFKRRN